MKLACSVTGAPSLGVGGSASHVLADDGLDGGKEPQVLLPLLPEAAICSLRLATSKR